MMSAATVLNWMSDLERADQVVYGTDAAVAAILGLIHTDLVRDVELVHEEIADALEVYLGKRASMSSGEQVLLDVAWSIWRGQGGAFISDLGRLDVTVRKSLLAIIIGYYLGALG